MNERRKNEIKYSQRIQTHFFQFFVLHTIRNRAISSNKKKNRKTTNSEVKLGFPTSMLY